MEGLALSVTLTPARSDDLPALFDLYRTVLRFPPPDALAEYWDWRFRRNPCDDGARPTYWVLKRGARLVGGIAQMPVVGDVGARTVRAYWAADFMVHPEERGRGLGRRLFAHCREASGVVLSMGPPADSATGRIAREVGFRPLPSVPYLFRLSSLAPILARLPCPPAVAAALRPISRLVLAASRPVRRARRDVRCDLRELARFDGAFDRLWEEVAMDGGARVRRTHETMNWRYADNPFYRYRCVGAWAGGRLRGCLVLKVVRGARFDYGTVPELIVPTGEEDIARTLLAWALDRFREARVDVVKALMSTPFLSRVLRGGGFRPLGHGCDVVLAVDSAAATGLDERAAAALPWYLTKGDSDLDVVPDFHDASVVPRVAAVQG